METNASDCGHRDMPGTADYCHRVPFVPCPFHFGQTFLPTLSSVFDPAGQRPFVELVHHLTEDNMATPAFYTWMAMVKRYAVPEGMDPEKFLRSTGMAYAQTSGRETRHHQVMVEYVKTSTRAAILGHADTLDATFHAAIETLSPEGLVAYLMSAAASASANTGPRDACTRDHYDVYATLGSQAADGWSAVVLPVLVDMVFAHKDHTCCPFPQHVPPLMPLFKQLVEADPDGNRGLTTAVELLTRVLGQTLSSEVKLFDANANRVVDIAHATDETDPLMMPTVWAVRAGQAFAGGADPSSSQKLLHKVVERRGDPVRFAADVIIFGTQIIADTLFNPDNEPTEQVH